MITESTLNVLISLAAGLVSLLINAMVTHSYQRRRDEYSGKVELLKAYINSKSGLTSEQNKEAMQIIASSKNPPSFWDGQLGRMTLLSGAGTVVVVAVLAIFWLSPILTKEPPTTPDSLIDSFEAKGIASEWSVLFGDMKLSRSGEYAFSGRYSLKANVKLARRPDVYSADGTAQLELRNRDIEDKIVIFRVYLPVQKPTNIRALLFIRAKQHPWIGGPSVRLKGGEWSTLAWRTEDAPDWESPATVGIEFAMEDVTTATDAAEYNGPIYVDLVELTDCPDIYAEQQILEPFVFYDFEQLDQLPQEITFDGHAEQASLTDQEHLSDGVNSLKVDLDLPKWKGEEDSGGIYVAFPEGKSVEAISAYVLIPSRDDTSGGEFKLHFLVGDSQGNPVWSNSRQIPVDEWTPIFWGTGYAHSDSVGWYEWKADGIQGFHIKFTRNNRDYRGPVYIDNLAAYQLSQRAGRP